ncbi:MAG: NADH:flavin oxidoreductase/NADH oxidase family protein [Bacteriovoracaceae bacterium]|nr:NADH:flavin oxidoreductase/NADH oxidase family protein [Bacteriovoracaceae bacterium]
MKLSNSLTLPCGSILPNRLAKSAMSENMAKKGNIPGPEFYNAYKLWVQGETGLIITGNVMIDSRYKGEPNNVVIEQGLDNKQELKNWSQVTKGGPLHLWVQLNHPGKQTPKFLTKEPVAPSAISLAPPLDRMFNCPKELSEQEILEIIDRFAFASKVSKECGFQGVQIHGAHGYLVSQFLSSSHNKREDQWGGSIKNRMRFVTEVYKAIRKEVGPKFPIGIKLNSADFNKGGFTHEESILVAKALSTLGIDLIEISGGSYEKPVMTGIPIKDSTKKREAYFLEYARDIKKVVQCPIMVTGGFRTGRFMNEALLNNELDLVGLARPLCLNPNFSKQLLNGELIESQVHPLTSGFKMLDKLFPLEIIWYTMQIKRMGKGKMPNPNANVYSAILKTVFETGMESIKRVR